MTIKYSRLLADFEAHDVNAAEFGHHEHLQVAFEMLHKYGFLKASFKYASAINTIATNAGAPEKFNMTITLAYLSLIAERVNKTNETNFDVFLANNQDLLSKQILDTWYSPERLQSQLARKQFLLPG